MDPANIEVWSKHKLIFIKAIATKSTVFLC
jgi:hypothetical protein